MIDKQLAFIDIETTGLSSKKHEIVEIGCILARQAPQEGRGPVLEIIETFDWKIRPERIQDADPVALRINGYNEEDWRDALSLEEALHTLAEKTRGMVAVGHNIDFDLGFLRSGFYRFGIPYPFEIRKLDVISIAFAVLYHQQRRHFSLQSLCDELGIVNSTPHRAESDIRATFEVYKKLLNA